MNKERKDPRPPKRPYEKPRLERIEISLEESLLAPCKSSGGFGAPAAGGCNACGSLGS